MGFKVDITLENPGLSQVVVTIPQGSLFETRDPLQNVQNLVAARDYKFVVEPLSSVSVVLDAYCANSSFAAPHKTPLRATPFHAASALNSQSQVWDYFTGRRSSPV
jgi:hypothetical protein